MKSIRCRWLIFKTKLIQRLVIKLEDTGLMEPDETEERLYREAMRETYGGAK